MYPLAFPKYYKLKCYASFKTKNKTAIETTGTHNHECDTGECKAKEVANEIKKRAQYSTPTVAIANEIYKISDDFAVQLAMPKKDTLLRAVSRKRLKAMCFQIPAPPPLVEILRSLMSLLPSFCKTVEKMIRSEL